MICLRCGYCCFYFVVIVKPESVKEDLEVDNLCEEDLIGLDSSTKCPHLSWDKITDNAVCAIHHHNWFEDTPCGRHNQEVETSKSEFCRIGKHMRDDKNVDVWKKLTMRKV